ncbi:MAG: glucosylglycerol hydrolase [Cyanobacteria bacterium P01_A01_bin.17]
MAKSSSKLTLVKDETLALLDWALEITNSDALSFSKGQRLATRLGAHYRPDGLTEIGFWTPELAGEIMLSERDIYLEVFTPLEPIDFRASEQQVAMRCDRLPLVQQGEYVWGVVAGLQPGRRDQAGSLYWLRYRDAQLQIYVVRDLLAYSLPYGVFAPAELYDLNSLHEGRADLDYFKETGVEAHAAAGLLASDLEEESVVIPRVEAPRCMLQLHARTASPEGTIEGLNKLYKNIATKIEKGKKLTSAEQNYIGYDAIQLLPIEPPIEYRYEGNNTVHEFFALSEVKKAKVWVTLRKPNTQNWGYDIPIAGSAAVSPSMLGSLRPDELIDFAATLHTFPSGPIQLIYDLVYGHADNQCEELLNRQYLKGPNMYGQDLNHQLPPVRAILLEMQRRKINTGADGIRVDGGQDFKFFNPLSGIVEYDDAYLQAMGDVIQDVGGYQRLMFTIYEDGRPWPQEGWEETSTYRDLIEIKPESFQWGPLIFAHNTPALEGFWDQKWSRVCEVMFQGENWITGCANHDTVRRGNQVDPAGPINWNLGSTLVEVLNNAYDNPAITLWVLGFSPGLPMEFLNAHFRGGWGFFRNTDERYAVKVVSEEAGVLDWQVDDDLYEQPNFFKALKDLGFTELGPLRGFTRALQIAMSQTHYDLDTIAEVCQRCLGGGAGECDLEAIKDLKHPTAPSFLQDLDVPKLQQFAKAFMKDVHEFANVSHWHANLQSEQVAFNLALRQFRIEHPWLLKNLSGTDRFNHISGEDHTLFYGLRTQPTDETDESQPKQFAMITHMGGAPATATLGDWLQLDLEEWQVVFKTPGLEIGDSAKDLQTFELQDSQGLLLTKIVE